MKTLLAYTTLACFLFGCNDDKLPEFTQIDKIRIIALEVNTPEVNPGATVTVTPWVSDINETVALTDSVSVCVDPGLSYGATPTCAGSATKIDIRVNQTLTITGANSTGSANTFNVTIPSDLVIFAGRTEQEKWNGVSYLIDYKLKNSSGSEVSAVRRIVVSDPTKTPKNTNPVFTTIFADGSPMVALPIANSKVQLSTDLNLASVESFQSKNVDGSFVAETELVAVTWMFTDGEAKKFRTDVGGANEYTGPSAAPSGRSAHLFAVARDNRAGVKVIKVQF